jgi:predicted aspartyl protease
MRMLGFFAVCVGCFLGGCTATRHWDGPEVEALIDGGGVVESGMFKEMPYIMASVNGSEPMKFVFDTGASVNLLFTDQAEKLGIRPNGIAPVTGASGLVKKIPFDAIDRVEFGPVVMHDMVFLIHDLDESSSLIQPEVKDIVGLIGINGLEAFTIDIDYPARQVSITQERLSLNDPETSLIYTRPGGLLMVPVEFVDPEAPESSRIIWSLLDTGNTGLLALKTDIAKDLIDQNELTNSHRMMGIHGIEQLVDTGPVQMGLVVGQTRLEGILASVSDKESRLDSSTLRNFHLKIDMKSQLVSFTRADNARRLVSTRRMGITNLSSFDGYRIDRVIKGSPAYLMGIRAYDKVLLIDGHEPTAMHDKAPYWAAESDATTITVRIERRAEKDWVDVVLPLDGSIDGIEERARINPKKPGIKVKMTGEDREVIETVLTPIENEDTQEKAAP